MEINFIHLPFTEYAYSFFYSLAFLVAFLILIYEGNRRKFPILPWILIIVFVRVFFILGSKITAFSLPEWQTMINNQILLPGSKKLLFGGLLFGAIGLVIGKRWLKFSYNTFDAFAVATPIAMAIQRLGCFFHGCCFGQVCELPWAVQYPVNTPPHFHQFTSGMIDNGNFFSLPVHPTQLYEAFGLMIVTGIVLFYRNRWRSNGNSALFSLSLILLVRFIVEFFRDPSAHTNGGLMIGPLNQVQWTVVFLIPLLVSILIFKERKGYQRPNKKLNVIPSLPQLLSIFITSAFIIWTFSNWFQYMEILALLIVFLPAALLIFIYILRQKTRFSAQLIYASLLILPFFLMSQSISENSQDSILIRKSKSLGIGFASGNFSNQVTNVSGSGCDITSNTNYFNQKYTLGAASLNFKDERMNKIQEANYGVNIIAGTHNEIEINALSETKNFIFAINPYYKIDYRWLGLGGGFHLGNMTYSYENTRNKETGMPTTGNKLEFIYPQFYSRIGPRDIFFIDYHYADFFPSALPGFGQQLGMGTGLGLKNGTNVRVGTTFNGTYVSMYMPIKDKIIIEPLLVFNKNTGQISSSPNFQFSIGIRYELSHKIEKMPANKD